MVQEQISGLSPFITHSKPAKKQNNRSRVIYTLKTMPFNGTSASILFRTVISPPSFFMLIIFMRVVGCYFSRMAVLGQLMPLADEALSQVILFTMPGPPKSPVIHVTDLKNREVRCVSGQPNNVLLKLGMTKIRIMGVYHRS